MERRTARKARASGIHGTIRSCRHILFVIQRETIRVAGVEKKSVSRSTNKNIQDRVF